MNLTEFFQALDLEFPLPSGDRRNHHIYLDKPSGKITVGVWWNERHYPVFLEPTDLIKDIPTLMVEISELVKKALPESV